MKKVLIAMDSFKGSLTSQKAGEHVAAGIRSVDSKIKIEIIEIADGGEGSLSVLKNSLKVYEEITVKVVDTLYRLQDVEYLITFYQGKRTAIIESAKIIGINLTKPSSKTINKGSSAGIGEIILDAVSKKCESIILFLGGTGTSDGGLGCLQALGANISTTKTANPLFHLCDTIDISSAQEVLANIELTIASDVTNPYLGELGFTNVFGEQKGADFEQRLLMEQHATYFVRQISEHMDISSHSGAGAGGGLGGALLLLGGKMQSGFDIIAKLIDLEEKIATSQLIYTGEGKIDNQTKQGKVPYQIGRLAQKYKIPVIGLVGSRTEELESLKQYLIGIFSIQLKPQSLIESMDSDNAGKALEVLAHDTFRLANNKTY